MALAGLALAVVGAAGDSARGGSVFGGSTPRQGELRETLPITREPGAGVESVLSLALPRLKNGDRIRFNAEVTVTTTCVEPLPRCIGRPYGFDPRLRARVVLAGAKDEAGDRAVPVSSGVGLSCEQTRPNRNHHCPLVISEATTIGRSGDLPCAPDRCRLNVVVGAHHPRAKGGEVVVIGADRPDGSVEGGKGRLSAAVVRARGRVVRDTMRTTRRRTRTLPASFSGGQRVIYSQRVGGLQEGDVLLVRGRQRTRIRRYPYFVATKIVLATRRGARGPTKLTRGIATRRGTVTETNGFNCTVGPSAFRSPCVTRKAGAVVLKRSPRDARGRPRPLYVNLVSRTFPKRAQARRRAYPPARVLGGGALTVTRLRAR